jgi:hypothetical protein
MFYKVSNGGTTPATLQFVLAAEMNDARMYFNNLAYILKYGGYNHVKIGSAHGYLGNHNIKIGNATYSGTRGSNVNTDFSLSNVDIEDYPNVEFYGDDVSNSETFYITFTKV